MNKQKNELHIWAEQVAKKIDDSSVFLQLFNPSMKTHEEAMNDPSYVVQLGYAVLMDKPIIILASYGEELPEKLERVADVVQRYDRGSMKSMGDAVKQAIEKIKSMEE